MGNFFGTTDESRVRGMVELIEKRLGSMQFVHHDERTGAYIFKFIKPTSTIPYENRVLSDGTSEIVVKTDKIECVGLALTVREDKITVVPLSFANKLEGFFCARGCSNASEMEYDSNEVHFNELASYFNLTPIIFFVRV